jgi:hypothetical protein
MSWIKRQIKIPRVDLEKEHLLSIRREGMTASDTNWPGIIDEFHHSVQTGRVAQISDGKDEITSQDIIPKDRNDS